MKQGHELGAQEELLCQTGWLWGRDEVGISPPSACSAGLHPSTTEQQIRIPTRQLPADLCAVS